MILRLDILLKELEKKLLFMLGLTEEIMNNAMHYYFEHQESIFKSVQTLENTINEYENTIDEQAIRIFALEHPVASDLRRVVMTIKMNTDLERLGDIAYNIASRAHATIQNNFYGVSPDMTKEPLLIENHKVFQKMIELLRECLNKQDIEFAKQVLLLDSKIDDNNSKLFRQVLQLCMTKPENANFYVNQVTISKNLERAGDHCTNLAQDLVYIFSGINIRHKEEWQEGNPQDTSDEWSSHGPFPPFEGGNPRDRERFFRGEQGFPDGGRREFFKEQQKRMHKFFGGFRHRPNKKEKDGSSEEESEK